MQNGKLLVKIELENEIKILAEIRVERKECENVLTEGVRDG